MTDGNLEGEGRNVMRHSAGIFMAMLTKLTKKLGEYSGCRGRDPDVEYEGKSKGKCVTNAYRGRYSSTHS
jgi:hypothetical protein